MEIVCELTLKNITHNPQPLPPTQRQNHSPEMSFPRVTAPPATHRPDIPLPVRAALERALEVCLFVLVLVPAEGVVVAEALDGGGGAGD